MSTTISLVGHTPPRYSWRKRCRKALLMIRCSQHTLCVRDETKDKNTKNFWGETQQRYIATSMQNFYVNHLQKKSGLGKLDMEYQNTQQRFPDEGPPPPSRNLNIEYLEKNTYSEYNELDYSLAIQCYIFEV